MHTVDRYILLTLPAVPDNTETIRSDCQQPHLQLPQAERSNLRGGELGDGLGAL
jgi:hypothetical protein